MYKYTIEIHRHCMRTGNPHQTITLMVKSPRLSALGTINSLRPRQDGRHFPDDISNAFSWMKMYKFRLIFPWSLFPRVQLTIYQHWFRLWLGAGQATSHYLNQWWFVHRRIYASLGLNELIVAATAVNEMDFPFECTIYPTKCGHDYVVFYLAVIVWSCLCELDWYICPYFSGIHDWQWHNCMMLYKAV